MQQLCNKALYLKMLEMIIGAVTTHPTITILSLPLSLQLQWLEFTNKLPAQDVILYYMDGMGK